MFIAVGVYAMFWGWTFALGFVVLLAIHELGHVVALRAQGSRPVPPMFIPLVGAFVRIKGAQRSVAEEAWSALAGPAMGTPGSLGCLQLAELAILAAGSLYSGFFLNLFNLAPTSPMDGGRVGGALHPAVWLGGIGVAVVLLVWRPDPLLGFILTLGVFETVRRSAGPPQGPDRELPSHSRGDPGPDRCRLRQRGAGLLWGMHVSDGATPLLTRPATRRPLQQGGGPAHVR